MHLADHLLFFKSQSHLEFILKRIFSNIDSLYSCSLLDELLDKIYGEIQPWLNIDGEVQNDLGKLETLPGVSRSGTHYGLSSLPAGE